MISTHVKQKKYGQLKKISVAGNSIFYSPSYLNPIQFFYFWSKRQCNSRGTFRSRVQIPPAPCVLRGRRGKHSEAAVLNCTQFIPLPLSFLTLTPKSTLSRRGWMQKYTHMVWLRFRKIAARVQESRDCCKFT